MDLQLTQEGKLVVSELDTEPAIEIHCPAKRTRPTAYNQPQSPHHDINSTR